MPRIVGGSAKGRRLKTPPGAVRPATARARTALFDYLSQIIPGSRILDLYCGSGGLGLEALSRGADSVCFVDISLKVINVVRDNVRLLDYWEQSSFEIRDVFRYLHNRPASAVKYFDVVMASPPYKISEPGHLLDAIEAADILADGGIVCLEYSRHTPAPNPSFFTLARRRIYGETVVEVWDMKSSGGESAESVEKEEC
jgi:16S rRNA (guanine(966)-N(2))-methyltransferase RsmD